MVRRQILPVAIAYGLWIVWACVLALRDAAALAANPAWLAWSIALRECGAGDYIPDRCIISLFRDILPSVSEPSLWTALWRLREFYAAFVLRPPMGFTAMSALATAIWCLVLLAGTQRSRSSLARAEWASARALNWPFSQSSG